MIDFIVQLPDNYVISDLINTIKPEEWVIILHFVNDFITQHNTIKDLDTNKIVNTVKKTYEDRINYLQNQINNMQNDSNNLLNDRLNEQKKQIISQYEQKLNNEKTYFDKQFTEQEQQMNELQEKLRKLRITYNNDINNKLNEQNDTLNKQYLQKIELEKRQIIELYTQQMNDRDSKLTEKDNKITELLSKITEQNEALNKQYLQKLESEKRQLTEIYNQQMNDRDSKLTEKDNKLVEKDNKITELLNKITDQTETLNKQYLQKLESEKKYITDLYVQQIYELNTKLIEQNEILNKHYAQKLESEKQQLTETYTRQINELQNNIINIKKDVEHNIHRELSNKYNKELEQKLYENKLLENNIKNYEDKILLLNKNIEDYKKQLLNSESITKENELTKNLISTMNDTLKPVLKFYTGTNMEKGNMGEAFVYNYLNMNERYTDGIVEDVSNDSKKTDLYWQWRQLKCIIEVKNKKAISKDDMTKFERDVKEYLKHSDKKINCGMFISLQTDIFPGRNRDVIQIDYIEDTPVVYIYAAQYNDIHYSISCLEKIVTHSNNDERNNRLIKHLQNNYNHLQTTIKYFEKAIDDKHKEIKNINTQLENTTNLLNSITYDYNKTIGIIEEDAKSTSSNNTEVTEVDDTESKTDDDDEQEIETEDIKINFDNIKESKKIIKNKIIRDILSGKSITMADLAKKINIKTSQFDKLGGYKNIVSEAKVEFINSIITPDVIKNIVLYKKEKGSYPLRPVMIQRKIITDSALRKLNKVVKAKKIVEFICEICENKLKNSKTTNQNSTDQNSTDQTSTDQKLVDKETAEQISDDDHPEQNTTGRILSINTFARVRKQPSIKKPSQPTQQVEEPRED